MRVEFLPEQGGRLYSLKDKATAGLLNPVPRFQRMNAQGINAKKIFLLICSAILHFYSKVIKGMFNKPETDKMVYRTYEAGDAEWISDFREVLKDGKALERICPPGNHIKHLLMAV
jgi:hypothetical protein